MAIEFDGITITLLDDETDEQFMYFAGYDSGDDHTVPDEYLDKLNDDENYKELSDKIEEIRKIAWG